LADHLASSNITVNCIAPGPIMTKMGKQLKLTEKEIKQIPLGRTGDPQDMGGAALFLVSPAAKWITGVILPVDGGILVRAKV